MPEASTVRRRRMTAEREAELYDAVLELLREVGYDALTMDAVATRTRSSKATLYRQWGGKAALVVKAMRHYKPVDIAEIDTGTLRGDLHTLARRQDDCSVEESTALMRGLAMAMHSDPHLLRAFRELLIEPELEELDQVLQRAVARGEVREGNPAMGFTLHMMVGAMATRSMIDELPPTQEYLISYIDAVVLPALCA
ncbi:MULTISPECIES: TetR/AcrR family transcriptional regulator [unclassified Streptomyces]|uniref:TetR/AcrR family transcriptional regulator n=1 Tax=unclassified Streptomyces TaxID=2593676 RepID=UPI00278BFD34|nr:MULTISPECIES: TetR/AcrR family transcriptional regulator [unclassified Streptomyces]